MSDPARHVADGSTNSACQLMLLAAPAEMSKLSLAALSDLGMSTDQIARYLSVPPRHVRQLFLAFGL